MARLRKTLWAPLLLSHLCREALHSLLDPFLAPSSFSLHPLLGNPWLKAPCSLFQRLPTFLLSPLYTERFPELFNLGVKVVFLMPDLRMGHSLESRGQWTRTRRSPTPRASPQDNSIKSLLLMPLISFSLLIFLNVRGLAVRGGRALRPSPPPASLLWWWVLLLGRMPPPLSSSTWN